MKLQYHAQIRTSNGIQIVSNKLRMFKKIEFNIPNRDNVPSQNVNDHYWHNLRIPLTDSIITQLDSQQSIGLLGLVPALSILCQRTKVDVDGVTAKYRHLLPTPELVSGTANWSGTIHITSSNQTVVNLRLVQPSWRVLTKANTQTYQFCRRQTACTLPDRYPWIHVNASKGHGGLHDCFETRGTMCHSTHLKQHN